MLANSCPAHCTPEDYLAFDAMSQVKHEYFQGQMFAMAGASNTHALIVSNLVGLLRSSLRGSGCGVYAADTNVLIPRVPAYFYPDLVVSCHPKDRQRDDGLEFPCLIVEVLSSSTEAFDRGLKFQAYQTLESLDDYLLVSQTQVRVDLYHREGPNQWLLTSLGPGQSLTIPRHNLVYSLDAIYEDIPGLGATML